MFEMKYRHNHKWTRLNYLSLINFFSLKKLKMFNLTFNRFHFPFFQSHKTSLIFIFVQWFSSCGPTFPAEGAEMISRRRILSRSRDDLNVTDTYAVQEEEEDVWYNRDKLYKVSTQILFLACIFPNQWRHLKIPIQDE